MVGGAPDSAASVGGGASRHSGQQIRGVSAIAKCQPSTPPLVGPGVGGGAFSRPPRQQVRGVSAIAKCQPPTPPPTRSRRGGGAPRRSGQQIR
eukprot:736712-Prorocentrum_minimum.AAC.1